MKQQLVIIIISFILGCSSGVIMHRSDFCIAGMFRDLFLFRSSPLLRSLLLAIAASMLLFETARLSGLPNYQLPSSLFGQPAVTNLLGGALFGIGMVLAGGCVVGTLYRMGTGNLPAIFAFIGLIVGSTLYAEFHPAWKQLTLATQLHDSATLWQLLRLQPTTVYILSLAILCGFLFRWQVRGQLIRPNAVKGYLQPRMAALLLALIGVFSFSLTGMPIGVSTSYAKVGAFVEQLSILSASGAELARLSGSGSSFFGIFWDGAAALEVSMLNWKGNVHLLRPVVRGCQSL